MLPLGRLALGKRDTKFTPDEQRTLMTLWSIARSPLIMGGDLRHLDAPTLALLTNRAVLAVNQASTDNRPHFVEDGARIWSATPEGTARPLSRAVQHHRQAQGGGPGPVLSGPAGRGRRDRPVERTIARPGERPFRADPAAAWIGALSPARLTRTGMADEPTVLRR
jgi:hypothetical protein